MSLPDKFLITGGCGFIGTSLIARILRDAPGASIRVLDNFIVGTPDDLARVCKFSTAAASACGDRSGVVLIEGDIRDFDTALACADGRDCVVHLAASTGVAPSVADPRTDMQNNILGTFNMLEAARQKQARKFVFASSGAPVGEVEPPLREDVAPRPVSPYGASKLAGEGYACAYAKTFGLPTVALRFGNVFGPGSGHKYSLVAKFIRQALAGETCEIYGDGAQTRDFIYIDDLVGALLRAIEVDAPGELFHIASGREHTVAEVAAVLAAVLKERGVAMKIAHAPIRAGDVRRNYADTTKAATVLGWRPVTALRDGIAATVDWFLASRG